MRANGTFVDVGGVHTYHEVSGAGEPVVLLHGGMCTVETFDAQTAALAEHFRVFVPERRGHGRTPDVPGPLDYEVMAGDTIAYLEALELGPVHLVGWSDGAAVGLLVAWRRPDLVGKLVFIGQNLTVDGLRPQFKAMIGAMTVENLPPMLAERYAAVSPDGPDHFAAVFERLSPSWTRDHPLPMSRLGEVTAPTLVLVGDDDLMTVPHAAEIRDAIANARLAVIPGASHAVVWEKPDLVNRLVLDFLTDVVARQRPAARARR
jgi:pimeloyl-ACP methyl ester carboxylesterase